MPMYSKQNTFLIFVRFHVLKTARLKVTVFWDDAPCSLVETDRRLTALMMKAVSTSEMSVHIYQTTRRNVLEDSHLHTCRRENLKSYIVINIYTFFDFPVPYFYLYLVNLSRCKLLKLYCVQR
jgi:hypothetical protein